MKWKTKRLGEVCSLTKGKNPNSFTSNGTKPYLTAKVVRQTENPRFVQENDPSAVFVNPDDIVIIMDGSNSGEMFTNLDGVLASTMGIVRYQKETLTSRFLLHFLVSHRQSFANSRTGSAIPHLSREKFENLDIPIPSLPEQYRIVKILDETFEQIAKVKDNLVQNLQNVKNLYSSALASVIEQKGAGWKSQRLKDVCEKITDGTHQTPTYFDDGIIFLSSRNVTTGTIDWQRIKYIDNGQHLEMSKRVAPRKYDILLAKNGTTGVAAMVDNDSVFDIYVSLALLRAKNMILPKFLLYFINSPIAKKQFNKRLKGIGVPNLHLEEIREVNLWFPVSLEEQQSIVSRLDALSAQIKKLESIYKQKLIALEELKKSILQKAFAGEL